MGEDLRNTLHANDLVKIPVFQEVIGKIQAVIADFKMGKQGNVAIIAEPFAGKSTLLEEIENKNREKVTKITFSSLVHNKENKANKEKITLRENSDQENSDQAKSNQEKSDQENPNQSYPDYPDLLPENLKQIVLLDNCHFLYMRKVGGFEVLYEFLDMISSRKQIFITTWNLYSWDYLDASFGIGKYFPVQIHIPKFSKEDLRTLILRAYEEGEIRFEDDLEGEKEPFLYLMKYPLELTLLGKEIVIPFPKGNITNIKKRFMKKEKQPGAEDRVFEKIYLESKGNPGLALRIWELGIEYPRARPEKIGGFSFEIELEYEEAFVLSQILSHQRLKKEEIAGITGSWDGNRAGETIFRLLAQELIIMDEESYYRLRPEALHSIASFLKNLRLVW